jgi:hypothetical protein
MKFFFCIIVKPCLLSREKHKYIKCLIRHTYRNGVIIHTRSKIQVSIAVDRNKYKGKVSSELKD